MVTSIKYLGVYYSSEIGLTTQHYFSQGQCLSLPSSVSLSLTLCDRDLSVSPGRPAINCLAASKVRKEGPFFLGSSGPEVPSGVSSGVKSFY